MDNLTVNPNPTKDELLKLFTEMTDEMSQAWSINLPPAYGDGTPTTPGLCMEKCERGEWEVITWYINGRLAGAHWRHDQSPDTEETWQAGYKMAWARGLGGKHHIRVAPLIYKAQADAGYPHVHSGVFLHHPAGINWSENKSFYCGDFKITTIDGVPSPCRVYTAREEDKGLAIMSARARQAAVVI